MLTLYLPHLDWSHPEEVPPLQTPALNQILRFGQKQHHIIDYSTFYFSALNIDLPDATAYAAPIAHQSGMHSVHISGAAQLQITPEEAQQICQKLNELYAEDGWRFTVHTPHWWRVDLPREPDWQTPCVLDVLGTADGMARPNGADGRDWLQKHTEIQMFLHSHPINEARREAGQLPINGLWLWHGKPQRATHLLPSAECQLFASDSLDAPSGSLPLPENWAQWCQIAQEKGVALTNSALYFNALSLSAENGDVHAYGWYLQEYDQHFFAPIVQAVKGGQLDGVLLHTQSGSIVFDKKNLWQFWRRTPTFRGRVFD